MATTEAIPAKYAGVCAVTGRHYSVGALIEKSRYGWIRADEVAHKALEAAETAPIHFSLGEGFGGQPYILGQVLRATWTGLVEGKPGESVPKMVKDGEHPQMNGVVVIVACGSTYYREDGWSFGVGDEQGRVYWLACRLATEEEAAPILAEEQRRRVRSRAHEQLEELFTSIQREGTYAKPASKDESGAWPQGEEIVVDDKTALYGGGQWLLLDDAQGLIWAIQGNGADGDDWSRNNFRGAIGCYRSADPAIIAGARAAVALRDGQEPV